MLKWCVHVCVPYLSCVCVCVYHVCRVCVCWCMGVYGCYNDSLLKCKYYLVSPGMECTSGDVRLLNGAGPYEGIVEVCHVGTWHTIVNLHWATEAAKLICGALGYSSECALYACTHSLTQRYINAYKHIHVRMCGCA